MRNNKAKRKDCCIADNIFHCCQTGDMLFITVEHQIFANNYVPQRHVSKGQP